MRARILIVEDDPGSLQLLRYLLADAGHEVAAAVNGAEGLAAALTNRYDLVLCDLQMPELSGYDVLARLRAEPAWHEIPVIAVTAYSMPGDRDAARAAGFTDYITKPIEPEALVAGIERHLPPGLRSR